MKTYVFVSRNKKLRLILKPSIPAEPLTGRNLVPGEFALFQDSKLTVTNDELAKRIMEHPGFNRDFVLASDPNKDPYASTRGPEVQHDLINIEYGHIGKNRNPKPQMQVSPAMQEYLREQTVKMTKAAEDAAEAKFNSLVEALKAKASETAPREESPKSPKPIEEGGDVQEPTPIPEELQDSAPYEEKGEEDNAQAETTKATSSKKTTKKKTVTK